MRILAFVVLAMSLLPVACGDDAASDQGSSSCVKSGARCVIGGGESCATKASDDLQDCNPDQNPGGAFCCAELAVDDAGTN